MKIVIVDSNLFSSGPVQRAVEKFAHVSAEFDQNADVLLWIKEGAESLPEGIEIKESNQFQRPFRMGALLDRVRRYALASEKATQQDIEIGPYMLSAISNELTHKKTGEAIRLTDKEAHILGFLSAQGDTFVDRETLLKEVWGYVESVETHTLETHIYRLRQKIEKDPSVPSILITDDLGYKLGV